MTNQSLSSSLLSRLAGPTVETFDDGTPGIRNCDSNKTSPMKQLGISSWCIIHLREIYDLTVIPMNTEWVHSVKKNMSNYISMFCSHPNKTKTIEVSNCTTWRRSGSTISRVLNYTRQLPSALQSEPFEFNSEDFYDPRQKQISSKYIQVFPPKF